MKKSVLVLVLFLGLFIGVLIGLGIARIWDSKDAASEVKKREERVTSIVQSGNADEMHTLLNELRSEGGGAISYVWLKAFSSKNISGKECAEIISSRYKSENAGYVRAKLVVILGANGTQEATNLLCKISETETDAQVLANITVALEKSYPARESLTALKRLKGDKRVPITVYGKAMISADGSGYSVEKWAEDSYHSICLALGLNSSDSELKW